MQRQTDKNRQTDREGARHRDEDREAQKGQTDRQTHRIKYSNRQFRQTNTEMDMIDRHTDRDKSNIQ